MCRSGLSSFQGVNAWHGYPPLHPCLLTIKKLDLGGDRPNIAFEDENVCICWDCVYVASLVQRDFRLLIILIVGIQEGLQGFFAVGEFYEAEAVVKKPFLPNGHRIRGAACE